METPPQAPGGIWIQQVRVKDLDAFAAWFFGQATGQQTAPISRRRARSLGQNPHASVDDVGLLVAWHGDVCVGYQVLIPFPLATSGTTTTVLWGSGFFVLPAYRHRLVALKLVKAVLELGRDVAISGFAPGIDDWYRTLRFRPIGPQPFVVMNLKWLQPDTIAERLVEKWGRASLWSRALTGVVNSSGHLGLPDGLSVYRSWTRRRASAALRGIDVRPVERISRVVLPRCGVGDADATFPRDERTINWMLDAPWFGATADAMAPPYFFDEPRRDPFRYLAFEFGPAGSPSNQFLVLSVQRSDGQVIVKVVDHRVARIADHAVVVALVMDAMVAFGATRLEAPLCLEERLKRLPLSAIVLGRDRRPYMIHPAAATSPLAAALPVLRLDPSDGDCAFF